jgi:hypothetical protein
MDSSVPPQKLKTHMKTKFVFQIVLFKKTLEFKHTIAFNYGRQQSLTLQGHVPSPQIWVIIQIVANTLGPMVQQCVLNQNWGYWPLLDAFVAVISLVCQMQTNCFDTQFHWDPRLSWWASSLSTMHAKIGYASSRTFPFIHALFSILLNS